MRIVIVHGLYVPNVKKFTTHSYNRAIKHFKEHNEQSKAVIPNVVANSVCIGTEYQDKDSYNNDYNVSIETKENETSSVI